jgi:predicted ATP-grasp superfamily ATP-dependent carboligase
MEPRQAVVCAGEAGINALATVRSLGRRGIQAHVVALRTSDQIASSSRYCSGVTLLDGADDLCPGLLDFARRRKPRPVLYIDNDPMMKHLAPHAHVLAARFELVDPVRDAERLTDKEFQVALARRCGISVPRTWFPSSWPELLAIKTAKRLIAKPRGRAEFKALIAASPGELAAELRARSAAAAEMVVQEYIEGDDAQIYAGLAYRAKSIDRCFVMSARKLRQSVPGAGVMAVGQAVEAPQVREMTRRLARAAGMHGVMCTEFKLDARDGKYYFIEWNPRPAYFQSLGWKAGFDLAWLSWCDHVDPARLEEPPPVEPTGHYWINLQFDLRHLAKAPGAARRLRTWLPYLARTEWSVFAMDDLAPWAKSMRQLGGWLFRGRSFGRALGRPVAPRA